MLDEVAVPLSWSGLWRLQRQYFARVGPEAWRRGVVPTFITTNRFIADGYASLIRPLLDDESDALAPVHIVELGAGAGRLAHHILCALDTAGARHYRYVLTDAADANIAFWRSHDRLRHWVDRGLLDFARFDLRDPVESMVLERSGATLPRGRTILIANYVFDGTELDLFEYDHGDLREILVRADLPGGTTDPADVELTCRRAPVAGLRYTDIEWAGVVDALTSDLRAGAFTFPISALECLRRFRRHAADQLVVISADKGVAYPQELEGRPTALPARHGSVSFGVNYAAIAEWTQRSGGVALLPPIHDAGIRVCAFAFDDARRIDDLRSRYEALVHGFGPAELMMVKALLDSQWERLDLAHVMAALRLTHWDADVFRSAYDRLAELVDSAAPWERVLLREGLLDVWSAHFELSATHDVGFLVGSLLGGIGFPEDAIGPLEWSQRHFGDDPATVGNLERCREAIARQAVAS